jgi:hypothetical protein
VAVDKLSVSLDEDLASVVREAAAEEGVSLSAWLSAAARDRIRNRLLRIALDDLAAETGPLQGDEVTRLVDEARRRAIVTGRSSSGAD